MKRYITALLTALVFLISFAHATNEYPTPFVITKTKVADANNYHFRVYSDGNWHCFNGPTNPAWSYLNEADSGAKTKILQLMTAHRDGNEVTLVTEGVTVNGVTYCKIKAVEM